MGEAIPEDRSTRHGRQPSHHRDGHVELHRGGVDHRYRHQPGFRQAAFGIGNFAVGLMMALSANTFGAAIGAILGVPLVSAGPVWPAHEAGRRDGVMVPW